MQQSNGDTDTRRPVARKRWNPSFSFELRFYDGERIANDPGGSDKCWLMGFKEG